MSSETYSSAPPSGLEKLSWKARRRSKRSIPVVQQMQWTDCGAACLAMVLGFNGRQVSLNEARELTAVDRDGVSATSILTAAEHFGLRGRGINAEVADLAHLPRATILHWEFKHFVVFDRVTKKGVEIVDPSGGRRTVSHEKFSRSFTGIALVLEPTQSFEPLEDSHWRLASYFKRLLPQKRLLLRILVTSIVLQLLALAFPLLTASIVDRVVPRADQHLLYMIAIGLLAVLAFQLLSELIRAHLLLQLQTQLDTQMTLGFVDHLVSLPFSFFQRRSAGDLMMRVNSNRQIRDILTSNTLSALLDGSLVLLYLALIFIFAPPMGFLVLVLGALKIVVFALAERPYRELMAEGLEAQAKSQSYLVQLLAGIETLKGAGAEKRAVQRYSNHYVDELNVSLARGRLSALVASALKTLSVASPMAVVAFGAVQVIEGQMSLGTMLALSALAAGFLSPLGALVSSALQLQLLSSLVERTDDVLAAKPEQDTESVQEAPMLSGQISMEAVSFRYGAQAPTVVQNVSFDIPAGSCVAIVGRSGSGKSTLAHLLLGLYKPSEGRILYDDHNLVDLEASSLRKQLGIVPQSPFIFGASVKDNIALANPEATDKEIIIAAAGAAIHDEIMAMPMGYETLLSDGGGNLSGGQRQRIAMARALLSRPPILLLDEATSSLDNSAEAQVMANLAHVSCTRILIAHRLSTIRNADLILVMDEGQIVEWGAHEELCTAGGAYQCLISAEAGGAR